MKFDQNPDNAPLEIEEKRSSGCKYINIEHNKISEFKKCFTFFVAVDSSKGTVQLQSTK